MEDSKELVIIKILSELQEKYDINNVDVKSILDKLLSPYTLLSNETSLMASDLPEKIMYFIGLKKLEGLSNESLDSYKSELIMFSRYVIKPVVQIDVNDIRRYLVNIQAERKYEKTTINNKISYLRTFFGTLYKEELVQKDPTLRIKSLKVDTKNLREYLTLEEIEHVRNACLDLREKTMVEFLYSTGCRVSETAKSKISEINWNKNSLIAHGKGSKDRPVYFNVKCKLYLQEYISTRKGDSDSLFLGERSPHTPLKKSGIEKIISKVGDRTGITKDIYPHIFRHSMATHALQRGMSIEMIQELLGHEQINTTQIYAKNNSKQLQLAYEQYCQ